MKSVDFIGIGAIKSGTTWLAKCLEEHPNVFLVEQKEINFFNTKSPKYQKIKSSNYTKGKDWYQKHFIGAKENQITGEWSPIYLWDKDSAKRIKENYPNVKLFAILRNPINRAFSHYLHIKQTFDIGSFEESLEEYSEEIKGAGLYGKQLTEFFELFPKENIHIMIFEEFKTNPQKHIKELFSFLGVDDEFIPKSLTQKVNVTKYPKYKWITKMTKKAQRIKDNPVGYKIWTFWPVAKSIKIANKIMRKINLAAGVKPILKEETKEELKNFYKKDIQILEILLEKNIDIWKLEK